jgi:hypothetical protein
MMCRDRWGLCGTDGGRLEIWEEEHPRLSFDSRECLTSSCQQVRAGRKSALFLRLAERGTIFCVGRSEMSAVGKVGTLSGGIVSPCVGRLP